MPAELLVCMRVLSLECKGQIDFAESLLQVDLMLASSHCDLPPELLGCLFRQKRNPILGTFAVAHKDMAFVEADIAEFEAELRTTLMQLQENATEQTDEREPE